MVLRRTKGLLFPEEIKQWKAQCLLGLQSDEQQAKTVKKQAKADKAEIKALKKIFDIKKNHSLIVIIIRHP